MNIYVDNMMFNDFRNDEIAKKALGNQASAVEDSSTKIKATIISTNTTGIISANST